MSSATPVASAPLDASSPKPEEVLAELSKLLLSRQLRESGQLQAFLDFVVRQTLAGRQDSLKEYLVGCQVFGRRADYDPRRDGIVRVQATALRKRLEKYYSEAGIQDGVVIDLPRGGYVPHFRYAAAQVPASVEPSRVGAAKSRWIGWGVAFLLGVALTAVVLRVTSPVAAFRETAAVAGDLAQLWEPFFAPGARNLVAFGVPLFYGAEGLMIRDVHVNVPEELERSRIAEMSRRFGFMPTPTDDLYTGLGEVVGTHLIANFFAARGVPVKVASARQIGASDLKDRNLVVVSSLRFQTLLRNMKLPADFEFVGTVPEVIRNHRPLPGEQREYAFESGAGVSTSYALVTLWPGPSVGRRILSIGGVHTWATQAATEFLLDPEQLRKVAGRMSRRGAPAASFQILLRVEGRGNQSQKVEYVAHHDLR